MQLSISRFFASQDVLAKVMSFSQSTSKAVCVLSANGSISTVSLWQAASSGGTVTYEVRISILIFLVTEESECVPVSCLACDLSHMIICWSTLDFIIYVGSITP